MEDKKQPNKSPNSNNNIELPRPKLIKRGIKIAQNKKENFPPVFTINKSTKKNSLQSTNNIYSNNRSTKIKKREIYSAGMRKSNNKPKKKKKKFKNIDEVVLLIQRCVRRYLYRIHNEPKLQMIKMLREKKRSLFENYKIIDKPEIIAGLKNEKIENSNDAEDNNILMNNDKKNNLNENKGNNDIEVKDNSDKNIDDSSPLDNNNNNNSKPNINEAQNEIENEKE